MTSRTFLCGVLLLGALSCALAAADQSDFYLMLEDGSKVNYGELRALAGPNRACCFPVNFPFAVTYSSTSRIALFISNSCEPGFEINSSAFPATVKQIDLCAKGCDAAKGCGLNGMNTKGVSTQGGKQLLEKGAACADSKGMVLKDKTCKAIGKDGKFAYRLLCKQDCSNAWTCQEPDFDRSKCSGVGPVLTFVPLGQKCGYTQDNKQYACGGNHVSCTNGVCTSTFPSGRR